VLSLFLLAVSKIEPSDVAKLNGYWEIEKVVFDKGEDKDYSINVSYDYFEIGKNKRDSEKVMPQLDGSFIVNDAFENVVFDLKMIKHF
jgi:hypothetical protein